MTLLAKGVHVTRENIEHAVEKIALSCCRGVIQHSVIVELIENGKIRASGKFIDTPTQYLDGQFYKASERRLVRVYGSGRLLGTASWNNLKKRLEIAGFTFEKFDNDRNGDHSIRMFWHPQGADHE